VSVRTGEQVNCLRAVLSAFAVPEDVSSPAVSCSTAHLVNRGSPHGFHV
jgi:hypothetical protein